MSWKEEYERKLCTAAEAVKHIKNGDTVVLGHAVGEPAALVDAMVANAANYKGVMLHHMVSLGKGAWTTPGLEESFRDDPMFASANVRVAIEEGRADFTPAFFHEVPKLLRDGKLKCDVVLLQTSLPDENGNCSMGVSSDYTYEAAKTAKTVIAQVNERYPWTYGPTLHISEFDHIVKVSTPIYELPPAQIGEVEEKIGANCASLIEDGSTLQLGIGGIPDAVMLFLDDKKDLGIHSEMISEIGRAHV